MRKLKELFISLQLKWANKIISKYSKKSVQMGDCIQLPDGDLYAVTEINIYKGAMFSSTASLQLTDHFAYMVNRKVR